MPSRRKQEQRKAREQKRATRFDESKRKPSNYRRKRKHLAKHGGSGTDYDDKPWKQ